jgi:uncharacterized protein YcfL
MKYALLLLALVGCSSFTEPKMVEQKLIMDKEIQSMGRSEIIDAVRQCETSGLASHNNLWQTQDQRLYRRDHRGCDLRP